MYIALTQNWLVHHSSDPHDGGQEADHGVQLFMVELFEGSDTDDKMSSSTRNVG